ncbi:MAG TPA: hypothetical protein VF032_04930 [Thermoleophilaceae bacterium]
MKHHRIGTLGVLLATVAACSPATANATPVTVNLRVEGSGSTVYEGPISTDSKVITTASGGSHECDGTQGGNPTGATPGGTPTTALDDAAHTAGFDWDGRYGVGGFDDFLVERVAGDGTVGTFGSSSWSLSVNRVAASVGGCQMRVNAGDTVLWEWTQYGENNLDLSAPAKAQVGQPVQVTVQQYDASGTLAPASGADVDGQLTDSSGHATLTFGSPGTQHLKATMANAIRSNAADVCVYDAGTTACDTPAPGGQVGGAITDKLPPSLAIRGIARGKRFRHGHGPRKLSGTAHDAGGLYQIYFELTRRTRAGCQWYSAKRSVFTRPRHTCHARFQKVGTKAPWSYLLPQRLPRGRYTLTEKAIDRSFNASREHVTFRVL